MSAKKAPVRRSLRWQFSDGSSASMSLAEFEFQGLCQAARALCSNDGQLQEYGERRLKDYARRLAEQRNASIGRAAAAKKAADGARKKGTVRRENRQKALASGEIPKGVSDRTLRRDVSKSKRTNQ